MAAVEDLITLIKLLLYGLFSVSRTVKKFANKYCYFSLT